MLYFSDEYRSIINERDKSFYDNRKDLLDSFSFVIKKYTGDDYWYLNDFLREGKVQKFSKSELKSWTYCLHSFLKYGNSKSLINMKYSIKKVLSKNLLESTNTINEMKNIGVY